MSKLLKVFRQVYTFISLARDRTNTKGIEAQITEAIVKRGKETRKIPKNFDAILVQFPKIDAALRQIKKEFDSLDEDNNRALDLREICVCLNRLKVIITEAEVESLFKATDMDNDGNLQFKEFILFVAFVYLMDPLSVNSTEGSESKTRLQLQEVEKAFEIMVDAFLFFDTDLDGVLIKEEIVDKFGGTTSKEKKVGASIAEGRFLEMDYDQNGKCSFKEFLYAFVGWVGTAEDEESENEEEP